MLFSREECEALVQPARLRVVKARKTDRFPKDSTGSYVQVVIDLSERGEPVS